MTRRRVLLIGHGCREAALAESIANDADLFAVMAHRNPGISERSKHVYVIPYANHAQVMAVASEVNPEFVMIGPEGPLEAGLTDKLAAAGFWTCAPIREAARLEWDKVYMREFLDRHLPECNVPYHVVRTESDVESFFRAPPWPVAVKPSGLTGGKKVRVQHVNLSGGAEAAAYAKELISSDRSPVLLEQKISGVEYTLHCVTDGSHTGFFRATYDYSYLYPGDRGPQTGGMGCYCDARPQLPFMGTSDYDQCCAILSKVLNGLRQDGMPYRGVLQGQFFLTADGPKICEFACRFGDPEAILLLSTLVPSWTQIMAAMRNEALGAGPIQSRPVPEVAICLAPPEYPGPSAPGHDFVIPHNLLNASGVAFIPGSCERTANGYRTCGGRAGALTAEGATIEEARAKIGKLLPIEPLYHRKDVASADDINAKVAIVRQWQITKA